MPSLVCKIEILNLITIARLQVERKPNREKSKNDVICELRYLSCSKRKLGKDGLGATMPTIFWRPNATVTVADYDNDKAIRYSRRTLIKDYSYQTIERGAFYLLLFQSPQFQK